MTATAFRVPRILAAMLSRFAGDRRGVSAVEFAMLLPLMIALYLGTNEISNGVAIDRKVTLTAGTVANLTASCSDSNSNGCTNNVLTTGDMTNIFSASSAIISPYSASGLKIVVSCISISSAGNATVSWSATLNGTARGTGSAITIPAALAVPSSQLIFSEVSYPYKPTIGYTITGTLTLSDTMYMSPRTGAPSYPDSSHTCS
jgi:Flp pilus assembly protein TadG